MERFYASYEVPRGKSSIIWSFKGNASFPGVNTLPRGVEKWEIDVESWNFGYGGF
jgi:hypothetical protein